MARRRYISTEISIDSKLNLVSDFAALFYTWGIPHARDDCRVSATIGANRRISPQSAEELLLRVVPGRKKTVQEVERALQELIQADLIGIDENGEIYYPAKTFYKYQTYINAANRRETPRNAVSSSSSLSSSLSDSDKNQNPPSASPTPSVGLKTSDKKTREEKLMASMNLIPELKKETDRLYGSDPKKFKRLASWVAQGRKHEHLETDMAEALRQFWDYRAIDDWYPYLDSILTKVEGDRSRDASLVDHERHKAEVREASKIFAVK